MEIKSLNNENMNYPKKEEINKNNLKNYIPKKWYKLGITGFVYSILINSKVFAVDVSLDAPLSGSIEAPFSHTIISHIIPACTYMLLLLVSIIGIIISTVKIKKNNENKKLKTIRTGFIILLALTIVFLTILYFL